MTRPALPVRLTLLVLVGSAVALGCSSGTASPAAEDDTGTIDTAIADTTIADSESADIGTSDASDVDDDAPWDPGPYPSGPYGTAPGEKLANLTWEGFVNDKADAVSTKKPYVTISMQAIRKTGRHYALLHLSEFT